MFIDLIGHNKEQLFVNLNNVLYMRPTDKGVEIIMRDGTALEVDADINGIGEELLANSLLTVAAPN